METHRAVLYELTHCGVAGKFKPGATLSKLQHVRAFNEGLVHGGKCQAWVLSLIEITKAVTATRIDMVVEVGPIIEFLQAVTAPWHALLCVLHRSRMRGFPHLLLSLYLLWFCHVCHELVTFACSSSRKLLSADVTFKDLVYSIAYQL